MQKQTLTEDDVSAIEPRCDDGGDEELRAVGVLASVSHGQETGLGVLQLEVLVRKLLAVNGLSTRTIVAGEVATLAHELGDTNDASAPRGLIAPCRVNSPEE